MTIVKVVVTANIDIGAMRVENFIVECNDPESDMLQVYIHETIFDTYPHTISVNGIELEPEPESNDDDEDDFGDCDD